MGRATKPPIDLVEPNFDWISQIRQTNNLPLLEQELTQFYKSHDDFTDFDDWKYTKNIKISMLHPDGEEFAIFEYREDLANMPKIWQQLYPLIEQIFSLKEVNAKIQEHLAKKKQQYGD